jgi:hypothetical protein
MKKNIDTFILRNRSEEVQEILSQKPRKLVLWGNVFLILLIVAFFIVNAFVTFTEVRIFPMIMQDNNTSTIIVPTEDVTKFNEGQLVHIQMEVYPQEIFGYFTGHVMWVNLIPDERGYSVMLKVDSVTNVRRSPKLISGMRGTASLEMSRRGFLHSVLMNFNN